MGFTNSFNKLEINNKWAFQFYFKAVLENSGRSYTHFTVINYDSSVIPDLKIPHNTTLEL